MQWQTILTTTYLAFLDSISPSIFGVQIFLLTSSNGIKKAILHTLGIFLTYFLGGLLVFLSLDFAVSYIQNTTIIARAYYILEIMAGSLLIQFAFYQYREKTKSKDLITKLSSSYLVIFLLGLVSTISDLPSSFAYISALILINNTSSNLTISFSQILLYNLIYIFPLILLILSAKIGEKTNLMDKLSTFNHRYSHILIAITSFVLGVILWFDGVFAVLFKLS